MTRKPTYEELEQRVKKLEDEAVDHEQLIRAVQDAQEYAENIVATVRDPLLILDADLRVVSVSRSFCETFKVTSEETKGQLIYELGNRQWDIPKLRELLENILPQNTFFNDYEVEHDFEHIGKRIMYLNSRRMYREADKTQLILLGIEDVTEKVIHQEKLAILGKLAGGVGHELRNPLGVIKNAAYFLNMAIEEPGPEVKETLEILDKEVRTSERIISSLLDFARPKRPTQRKVSVNEIVQDSLSSVTVPENVEVVCHLDEALPSLLADPDQLRQIFGNIILNAVQVMSDGGHLTITSATPAAEWLSVSFTDTGAGISEEAQEKIFEPLFTTKAKGIGLGLALTRTLVEGHGGTIEVKSEVGRGSTFTVRLPIRIREEK